MKKIILVLILISNIAFAQDKYPQPFKFNYYNKGTLYNNHPLDGSLFTQDSFWLGTQWGGHPKMLKALKMNGNHGTLPDNLYPAYLNSTGHKLQYIWENKVFDYARGFQFEPTLYIPDTNRGKLITRNHQIFGFSKVLGTIDTTPSNENYDRLILGMAQKDSIVLAKSWINNQYYNIEKDDDNPMSNGKRWVFSINLRRLDKNELRKDTISGRIPILTIKLPYKLVEDKVNTFYIKFNQTSKNISNKELLSYSPESGVIDTLGYSLLMDTLTTNVTEFVIYDDMLPDSLFFVNNKRQDVTLNAYFITDGDAKHNPLMKKKDGPDGIDSLDIEVKYHGNTSIAINHLRIATQDATRFFNGTNYNAYRTETQRAFDSLYAQGYEIYGMYGQDEYGEEFFSSQRYNSHLMNFQTISEGAGGGHVDHLIEHIQPKNIWWGAPGLREYIGAPYFWPNTVQYGSKDHNEIYKWVNEYGSNVKLKSMEWMNYATGHTGNWTYYSFPTLDSLQSTYETDLGQRKSGSKISHWKTFREFKIDTNIVGIDIIINKLINGNSTLGYIDVWNYTSFYYLHSYIYSEKPWWSNFYPVANMKLLNDSISYLGNNRPKTAEEVRVSLWNRLIFGAKGFCYDARVDKLNLEGPNWSNSTMGFIGNYHNPAKFDQLSYDDLINTNDPSIGGDFIPLLDSSTFIHNYVNRDTMAKYLRVPKDRIYYGRKSPRLELFKMHSFIRANDAELMNLRLQATFSKGTLIFENQHPSLTDTLLNKLVLLDRRQIILSGDTTKVSDIGVKSRPIGRIKNGQPHYETYDSTFFDLTIHKHKDKSMDSVFYIAVLNKRTDPLIMIDTLTDSPHLLFLTDDEFGKLCRTGGYDPTRLSGTNYDSTFWQKKWWSRYGARELTIPFDFVDTTNTNHYNLLKVEELSGEFKNFAGNKLPDSLLPHHLQSKYYHYIDTVLGQDGNLVLNMLPGQGKILKVTVLKPDLSINGRLDHSNQSKLVAYPILDNAGNETNKIQYHVVYFREDSLLDGNPRRVYYRKSYPMAKNDATENIVWLPELRISDSIFAKTLPTHFGNFNYTPDKSCDFPSIVVRKDTVNNQLKAYIVYTCSPSPDSDNQNVVLCVLNTTNSSNQSKVSNKVISEYSGSDRRWFGNPVINASAFHNYIAWSDSNFGIVASVMLPEAIDFFDSLRISKIVFGGNPTLSSSNHPSLNTYSRMSAEEDNCALVWQHSSNTNNYYKNILYTRLKVENDTLKTYSATQITLNSLARDTFYDNNILRVNKDVNLPHSNQFPVVYRILDNINYTYPNNKTEDVIAWQSTLRDYDTSSINGRVLRSIDLNTNSSSSILGWQISALQDNYKDSFLPDIAQQSGLIIGGEMKYPYGKYLINFVRGDSSGYKTYNFPTTGSWVSDINVNNNSFQVLNQISTKTKQPHLAKYKEPNLLSNIWRNRRVYEEYSGTNYGVIPKIVSNGRFFYKNNETEELEAESLVGFNKGSSKYQIGIPQINNQNVALQLPFIAVPDSTSFITYDFDNSQDTIFSNWFDVNTVADLNFKCYGFNDTIMVAKIQKQSDNSFINLNLPLSTTDTTGKLGEYTLINGGLHTYRLCFIRLDTNYQYTETLVLDGLPVSDTVMLKGTESSKNIIDLSGNFNLTMNNDYFNIAISPNPANDIVYMTPLYNDLKNQNLVEVEILDNLGNSIHKKVVKSGETFSFITIELSQGIYIVNCKEVTSDWLAPSFLKATKFVVNR
jgi:hypothetical protein